MLYVIHGAHHDYPNDPKRLVVPPLVSLIGGVLLYWMSYALFGRIYAAPFFGALVLLILFMIGSIMLVTMVGLKINT